MTVAVASVRIEIVTRILLSGRDAKFTATLRYITPLWNLQICTGYQLGNHVQLHPIRHGELAINHN